MSSEEKRALDLREILNRLDQRAAEVRQNQELQKETESLQILADLIREQLSNENIGYSARPLG